MKYRVTVPLQDDMDTIEPFMASSSAVETKEQNALWTINNMRRHNGLKLLRRLPAGTTFEPLADPQRPSLTRLAGRVGWGLKDEEG